MFYKRKHMHTVWVVCILGIIGFSSVRPEAELTLTRDSLRDNNRLLNTYLHLAEVNVVEMFTSVDILCHVFYLGRNGNGCHIPCN